MIKDIVYKNDDSSKEEKDIDDDIKNRIILKIKEEKMKNKN